MTKTPSIPAASPAEKFRVLIVQAPYYEHIASQLLDGAKARLATAGCEVEVASVPGALEIPGTISIAYEFGDYDGFVALGCVIRGETTHYEIVSGESARGLMDLAIDGACIGNGILTVENEQQALIRSNVAGMNKGAGAAEACLAMMQFRLEQEDRVMTDAKGTSAKSSGKRPRPKTGVARSASRLGAVQALYQMDVGGAVLSDILADYGSGRIGVHFDDGQCGDADYGFLKAIVEGVVTDQLLIDKKVNECLGEGWTLARLEATSRAILRAGGFELLFRDDVPPKVIISEYVEVAKAFFAGSEPGFVNASLDALARKRRPEEM